MTTNVRIGRDSVTGQPVAISKHARDRSTYLVGIQGMGKTSVLEQLCFQDMVNGDGLLFLDPHGDSAAKLLERVPNARQRDVVVWDPGDREHPIGINPFYCPDPERADATADSFVAALAAVAEFAEIFKSAPQMKNLLQHLAIAFVVNPDYTLIETPRFLQDERFRQTFYPKLRPEYPQVVEYWDAFDRKKPRDQEEYIASSLNKLQRFGLNRTMRAIFGQPIPKLQLRTAMDAGKVILVFLNRDQVGPDNAALIGSFIISQLLQAALSRIDTPPEKRRQFHVVADEFQTFMTTAFPTLIEEGRKYGVDVTIAHQIREQLAGDVKELTRAVGNLIVFRVTAPNAVALAGEFKVEPAVPVAPLVSDPWAYLHGGGHTNPKVYRAVSEVQRLLEEAAERYSWEHEVAFAEAPASRRAMITFEVGRYLYRRMSGDHPRSFSASPDTSPLAPIVKRAFSIWDDNYKSHPVLPRGVYEAAIAAAEAEFATTRQAKEATLAGHKKDLEEERASYRWDSTKPWPHTDGIIRTPERVEFYRAETREQYQRSVGTPEERLARWTKSIGEEIQQARRRADFRRGLLEESYERASEFIEEIERLGDLLFAEPIRTVPQTLTPTRTIADLTAETANTLTNLEKFHALCKLETERGIENVTIVTEPLAAPGDADCAAALRARSAAEYGGLAPRPSATMEEYGGDDDPNDFGEKATPDVNPGRPR